MDILRLITAGSVDDGKSTLIGRLLCDSQAIWYDQFNILKNKIDFSFFTDGLRAEREQGITIDVAYKYFSTYKRKFIIADTPGHIQYTRNMITGASTADLAIILIDVCNGIVEQTKRHSIISKILGINTIILAVNKMDLVNFEKKIYKKIIKEYKFFGKKIQLNKIITIPISAKLGDNIIKKSFNMSWYNGSSLLEILENINIKKYNFFSSRFPVQYIIKSSNNSFFYNKSYRRGYAGKIISGIYKEGDFITILPSKMRTKIFYIENNGNKIKKAYVPQSVVIYLHDDIDISRGDIFVKTNSLPFFKKNFYSLIFWMSYNSLKIGNKYILQINSYTVKSIIEDIIYRIDINTLKKKKIKNKIKINDLIKVKIKTSSPVAYDKYKKLRENGAAILIDETNNATVGACMIE